MSFSEVNVSIGKLVGAGAADVDSGTAAGEDISSAGTAVSVPCEGDERDSPAGVASSVSGNPELTA